MAKVIIMMVTRHEYIVGIYFSIIPPWRAGGGRIYTLHNIHVEFPLSWGPFYGLKGAEDQRLCKPGGYLPIKRLTIFPTIYVWRPAALTFGRTLSVSQSTWIQKRTIKSRKSVKNIPKSLPKSPFCDLKGAEVQGVSMLVGCLPIKRLTILPTICVCRPTALTFGQTLHSDAFWLFLVHWGLDKPLLKIQGGHIK